MKIVILQTQFASLLTTKNKSFDIDELMGQEPTFTPFGSSCMIKNHLDYDNLTKELEADYILCDSMCKHIGAFNLVHTQFYMLSGPPPLFACNTQWYCIRFEFEGPIPLLSFTLKFEHCT